MDLDQLIADLQKADPAIRAAAAEQLARAGEAAQPAAVELVRAAGDSDSTVRDWTIAALESLGPPEAKSAAALAELLNDPRLDVAYWASSLLGRLGATGSAGTSGATGSAGATAGLSSSVLGALACTLQSHPEPAVRERAAWALGQIGPAAASPEVITALQRAAANSSPRLERLAGQSLKQITAASGRE